MCDHLLLLIFPEEVNPVLTCLCSLQRCSYLHSLVCLVPQLPTPALSINFKAVYVSQLLFQTPAGCWSCTPVPVWLFTHLQAIPVLQAFSVATSGFVFLPPSSSQWGDLLFPQLFSATCLVSLSSPRSSKNTSGCCVCIALKRHLPDSVLNRKRRGKEETFPVQAVSQK